MSSSFEAQSKHRKRFDSLLWLGVALVITGLIYRRLWVGRVLAGGDLHTYFFPYWAAVVRSLQQGDLPLWNPDLFAGAPLLANSQVGVYYPLNWLCWLGSLMAGGTLASVTQAIHASVLIHLELAALTMFILARRLHLSTPAAALAAVSYAGNGFLGVHVEHLNQLQALAWLPLLLIPVSTWFTTRGIPVLPPLPQGEAVIKKTIFTLRSPGLADLTVHPVVIGAMAMILLAGHTQMAFIALVMLSLVTVTRLVVQGIWKKPRAWLRSLVFWLPLGLAALIAMAQLVPTFELARYSARSGGLPWREAVSFSLPPRDGLLGWLPTYMRIPQLPESVIAFGMLGIFLAIFGVIGIWRQKNCPGWLVIALAVLGLALALGGYNPVYLLLVRLGVPGLVHFRAPARYVAISVLSVALMAGFGLDALRASLHSKSYLRFVPLALVFAVSVELLISANGLPHADATLARAYTDLRPATAHLVASAAQARQDRAVAPRFLSITKTLFEVGDKTEIESIYASHLTPDALMAYLVSAKQREVLVPNLSLAFNVPAVDGYDGGLLPMRNFQEFSKVLLPEGTLDGRLRENLTEVPDARWLDLLNVSLIITDKVADTWVDDVFYDRQFSQTLADGYVLVVGWLPDNFTATGVRLLAEGEGAVIAHVTFSDGTLTDFPLTAMTNNPAVLQSTWETGSLTSLTLEAQSGPIIATGATLVDSRSGAFYPLVLSPDFRLAHSGDVKIYQRLETAPRAWLAYECENYTDDAEIVARLQSGDSDMGQQVFLSDAECQINGFHNNESNLVRITSYRPHEIVLDVELDQPGYLVLGDAWYPGWQAQVVNVNDNSLVNDSPVERANLFQRAIFLKAGHWLVTFRFHPTSVYIGIALSGVGFVLFVLYAILWSRKLPSIR